MKISQWVIAMEEELKALQQDHTWELVPKSQNENIVGSKWVYKIKYKEDAYGSVDRFKAQLVVKGSTKVPSVDFEQTFSPVIKSN